MRISFCFGQDDAEALILVCDQVNVVTETVLVNVGVGCNSVRVSLMIVSFLDDHNSPDLSSLTGRVISFLVYPPKVDMCSTNALR